MFILAISSRKIDDADRAAGHAAVAAVKAERLYRRTHATFDDWFSDRSEAAIKRAMVRVTTNVPISNPKGFPCR